MKLPFIKSAPESVAAIDLGSNSFHMIVARLHEGHLTMLDRLKEMVRLGAGLDEKNNLTEEAMTRALDCLALFGQRLKHMPPGSVRIIGTNTLRKAKNSSEFLKRAEQLLGHPIEVVSGLEEARLIYLGVAHGLDHDSQSQRLVIDIGGGSTEMIIGQGYQARLLESLNIGCVSMTQRFFAKGMITSKSCRRAILAVWQYLEPYEQLFHAGQWEEALGASGTVKAIGKVVTTAGWCEEGISRKALDKLVEKLIEIGNIESLQIDGLSSERAPVFVGGVMVLAGLFAGLGIEHMRVSDSALREGTLYDMVGRIRHEDARDQNIVQLAKKFSIDSQQVERLHTLHDHMLEQLLSDWQLDEDDIQQLKWATDLHEIGLIVSHSQYHKHGAYLIENADLLGFSKQEQFQLALLVRSQRGKFPLSLYKSFNNKKMRRLVRLAVLLRLGVVLYRSRGPLQIPTLQVKGEKRSLKLTFPEGWLDEHPLTRADLETEADYLKSAEFDLLFE